MIGFIDWTERKISLYLFKKKDNQYAFVDTISAPVEGELNQTLLTSLVKTNIEHVFLSVPVNLLSIRELSFPFSDKNKIKDTISYELEGILLGNVSDYSIDHIIIESSESDSRVFAACMEKTNLKGIIDLFLSAGLEPTVITSLDMKFSSKNIEMLFEAPVTKEEIRAEAAREELLNPSINLRQNELAYKGDIERIKKSLRLTSMLVLLLFLIIGADTAVKLISIKKENALLTKKINKIYHSVFPEETKIVDALRQFKGRFSSLIGKKITLGGMPILDILLDITNIKNKHITLSEVNIDGGKILIKGTARSFENVDALKNALSSSFMEIRVLDSKSSPDRKISFSIIMREKTA